MIKSSKLSFYRNSEYIRYMKDIQSLCNDSNPAKLEIEDSLISLQNQIEIIDKLYIKENSKELTQELELFDQQRDACIVGIRSVAKGYTNHFNNNLKNAANLLIENIDQYGENIARFNYQAETETLAKIVLDLQTDPELVQAVRMLHLQNWVEKMNEYNQKFMQISLQRVKQKADISKMTVVEAKNNTTEAYRSLVNLIEAQETINQSKKTGKTEYQLLINQINILIDQYNQVIENRSSKNNEEEEVNEEIKLVE